MKKDPLLRECMKYKKIYFLTEIRQFTKKGKVTFRGMRHLFAVEIKSDEDDDEATPAKAEWAKAHFEAVNAKLLEPLPGNVDKEYKQDIKQFYTFDLLKPEEYVKWFKDLRAGKINY